MKKCIKNFLKQRHCYLEPIGLMFLLLAFGWQCIEVHSNQKKMEGYIYELNEKALAIGEIVLSEAIHNERYKGEMLLSVNYDLLKARLKDWNQMQKELSVIDNQTNLFWKIRVFLYVFGSILVILSKSSNKEL